MRDREVVQPILSLFQPGLPRPGLRRLWASPGSLRARHPLSPSPEGLLLPVRGARLPSALTVVLRGSYAATRSRPDRGRGSAIAV